MAKRKKQTRGTVAVEGKPSEIQVRNKPSLERPIHPLCSQVRLHDESQIASKVSGYPYTIAFQSTDRICDCISRIENIFETEGWRLRVNLVLHLARDAVLPLYATVGEYWDDSGGVMHIAGNLWIWSM